MHPAIIEVHALDNHILEVLFDNCERGQLDMAPYLEIGVFQRLKKAEQFQQVKVAFDTVEWACGVDLDPEFVYRQALKG